LGIVEYRDFLSFVWADIPGIIEGASEGKGLGTRFLKHIERNSSLLFLIPADDSNPRKTFSILLNELQTFNPELLLKQRVVGISKADLLDEELLAEMKEQLLDLNPIFFSSVTGQGIPELKDRVWSSLHHD
jgi:GTP-binding protein